MPLAYYLQTLASCLLPLASCLLPLACSLFPIPYSLFPIPYNPQETSLILSQKEAPPLLTPVISGNSQRGDIRAFK